MACGIQPSQYHGIREAFIARCPMATECQPWIYTTCRAGTCRGRPTSRGGMVDASLRDASIMTDDVFGHHVVFSDTDMIFNVYCVPSVDL